MKNEGRCGGKGDVKDGATNGGKDEGTDGERIEASTKRRIGEG